MSIGRRMDEPRKKLAVTFGANVRRKRTELGVSSKQLGEELGVYRSYVTMVERGERVVGLYLAHQIALKLGVTLDELVEDIVREGK